MRHYHPTKLDTGQTLLDFERTARNQDNEILTFMQHHASQDFTAYELDSRFQGKMLLTSIRRALTNLEKAGLIECTGSRMEKWGKRNGTYKIKS